MHELYLVKVESIHRPPDALPSTNKTALHQSHEGVKIFTKKRIVFSGAFYPRQSHNAPRKYPYLKLNLTLCDGRAMQRRLARPVVEHRIKWTRVSTLKILNRLTVEADLFLGGVQGRALCWVGEAVGDQVWRV